MLLTSALTSQALKRMRVWSFFWSRPSKRRITPQSYNFLKMCTVMMLTGQMEILKVLLKDGDFLCFDDIILKIKEFLTQGNMISEVITICKLILVNPAISAAGERSFSIARRLKTWLRSSMTQERFSNLAILNSHKDRTDRLSLLDIANEFKNGTVTENEILVCLENPMYSNITYYFTALL